VDWIFFFDGLVVVDRRLTMSATLAAFRYLLAAVTYWFFPLKNALEDRAREALDHHGPALIVVRTGI
jgi:hypothetical protein